MRMMISEGKLPKEAEFTAKFISIFDTFNSSSRYDAKAMKLAITKTSKDWKFFQDTYNYGANLKPQGGKAILPTLEGWLRNSRSL